MKILFIVLDGGGDVGERTPYEIAQKPTIDSLAKQGVCGLVDIGYERTPQSDVGYLTLLGMYSKDTYPGRGYLEALGIGINPDENDICIRGNFATLDERGNIVDRRAGRLEDGLDELAEAIDGIEIDGIHFEVKRSAGHRVVIVAKALDEAKKLSELVTSNDPERTASPVLQIKPRRSEAKFMASVLNRFVARTHRILSKHSANKKRRIPANVLLLRGFGRKKVIRSFEETYGLRSACVAGIPIAKGVARFVGMRVIEVEGATGYPDTNLEGKISTATKSLETYDFVWLHINGTDILSHDGKRKEKKEFIERIDSILGKHIETIDMKDTIIVLTSDHRTASDPSFVGYRHLRDPVPSLISGDSIEADDIERFDERLCERGFRVKGNFFIRFILSLAR